MQPTDVSRQQQQIRQAPHHHSEWGYRCTCAQGAFGLFAASLQVGRLSSRQSSSRSNSIFCCRTLFVLLQTWILWFEDIAILVRLNCFYKYPRSQRWCPWRNCRRWALQEWTVWMTSRTTLTTSCLCLEASWCPMSLSSTRTSSHRVSSSFLKCCGAWWQRVLIRSTRWLFCPDRLQGLLTFLEEQSTPEHPWQWKVHCKSQKKLKELGRSVFQD